MEPTKYAPCFGRGMYPVVEEIKPVELRTWELDGKYIGGSSETEFLVQVGKGPKGSYRTRYSFKGDLGRAVFYYNGINIGNGYKKRLFMPSAAKNPVLAVARS